MIDRVHGVALFRYRPMIVPGVALFSYRPMIDCVWCCLYSCTGPRLTVSGVALFRYRPMTVCLVLPCSGTGP